MKRFSAAILLPRLEQMSNRHFIKISPIKNKRGLIKMFQSRWNDLFIMDVEHKQTRWLFKASSTIQMTKSVVAIFKLISEARYYSLLNQNKYTVASRLQDETTYSTSLSTSLSWTIISSVTVSMAVNLRKSAAPDLMTWETYHHCNPNPPKNTFLQPGQWTAGGINK